jgi:tRNA pseudouridine13 synthase
MNPSDELPYAHGPPPLAGRMRSMPEDFAVDEELGFSPCGTGEHQFIRVEKRGANSEWVARQLGRYAGVAPALVSYAGMKDRHAVARQTFSLHLPGKSDPDWAQFADPDIRILEITRHARKLKRGALKGNRFRLVLRDVQGDHAAAEQRWATVGACGVPNYFGEQRFGRSGDNVEKAKMMFGGARVQRHERGLLLSAARSHLFNSVLAGRVERGQWDQALDGEVWMLAGSHAIFGPETLSPDLQRRLREGDIDPTGPLWGRGELRSQSTVAAIEREAAAAEAELVDGLTAAGLEQERRSLRLRPLELGHHWIDETTLVVEFWLPSGAYATVVLRELCRTINALAEVADSPHSQQMSQPP